MFIAALKPTKLRDSLQSASKEYLPFGQICVVRKPLRAYGVLPLPF
jgi:hypothetical protein